MPCMYHKQNMDKEISNSITLILNWNYIYTVRLMLMQIVYQRTPMQYFKHYNVTDNYVVESSVIFHRKKEHFGARQRVCE